MLLMILYFLFFSWSSEGSFGYEKIDIQYIFSFAFKTRLRASLTQRFPEGSFFIEITLKRDFTSEKRYNGTLRQSEDLIKQLFKYALLN